jgi:hypothetical protein
MKVNPIEICMYNVAILQFRSTLPFERRKIRPLGYPVRVVMVTIHKNI